MSDSVIAGIIMRDLARSQLDSGASSGSWIATRQICDPEHRCITSPFTHYIHIHAFGKPATLAILIKYVMIPSGFALWCRMTDMEFRI